MRAVEKRLREKIRELEKQMAEVEKDRAQFRESFAANLRDAIRVHGEGKTFNMSSLIETYAKQLQKVAWFCW